MIPNPEETPEEVTENEIVPAAPFSVAVAPAPVWRTLFNEPEHTVVLFSVVLGILTFLISSPKVQPFACEEIHAAVSRQVQTSVFRATSIQLLGVLNPLATQTEIKR